MLLLCDKFLLHSRCLVHPIFKIVNLDQSSSIVLKSLFKVIEIFIVMVHFALLNLIKTMFWHMIASHIFLNASSGLSLSGPKKFGYDFPSSILFEIILDLAGHKMSSFSRFNPPKPLLNHSCKLLDNNGSASFDLFHLF